VRIVPLVMVLALCLLGAAPSLAGDGDVMQHLGMLGEWAPNCRLPLGPTNGRVVLSLSPGGEVTTLTRTGPRQAAGIIRNVRVVSDSRVRWSHTLGAVTYEVVIERSGGKYRSIESIGSDGKVYIKNGFMTNFGWGSPWLERCAGSSQTDITEGDFADAWQGCSQTKDRARTIRDCTRLISAQPDGPIAYNYRGLAYAATGDIDKAVADFSDAVRIDPLYADTYNNRAWAHFELGRSTLALADVQRALDLKPDEPGSLDTRAHIYEMLGRRDEAIADYRQVLSLIPRTHSKYQETADALSRLEASPR